MKIRPGESVLMAVALNTGGFVTLTLDRNDNFQLIYDRNGKKINLPQWHIDRMLKLRKELANDPGQDTQLPFFKDKKEIA